MTFLVQPRPVARVATRGRLRFAEMGGSISGEGDGKKSSRASAGLVADESPGGLHVHAVLLKRPGVCRNPFASLTRNIKTFCTLIFTLHDPSLSGRSGSYWYILQRVDAWHICTLWPKYVSLAEVINHYNQSLDQPLYQPLQSMHNPL